MRKVLKKNEDFRFVHRPSPNSGPINSNSLAQQMKQALRNAGGKCGPARVSSCIAAYPNYQAGTYPW